MVNRGIEHIFVGAIFLLALVLPLGCSSKDTPKANSVSMEIDSIEEGLQDIPDIPVTDESSDMVSLQSPLVSSSKHGISSGHDTSVNPYYDEGYQQGLEDGYDDGVENLRGDSYDDSCPYRGKKRKEYELGYEEGYESGFDDGYADNDLPSEEEE